MIPLVNKGIPERVLHGILFFRRSFAVSSDRLEVVLLEVVGDFVA